MVMIHVGAETEQEMESNWGLLGLSQEIWQLDHRRGPWRRASVIIEDGYCYHIVKAAKSTYPIWGVLQKSAVNEMQRP
jgi:hypothetical protein